MSEHNRDKLYVLQSLATKLSQEIELLIEHNAIKCGDKEPLNKIECIVFDNLNKHLNMLPVYFDELTHEQKFSAARVIVHQGLLKIRNAAISMDYLGLQFDHIFIGIEKDGYAHS